MKKRTTFLLISLLMPGLGYLLLGESRRFYVTVFVFYSIAILGSILRLYPVFSGLIFIIFSLSIIHVGTTAHAVRRWSKNQRHANNGLLKWVFTTVFFLLMVTSFGNARTMLGFDRVSMAVPVMEPAIIQGEQLLVDTWAYKSEKPKRGDIVIHSFSGQGGLFLNRIIAVGGDRIQIDDGKVWINGILIKENYVRPENLAKEESIKMPLMIVPMHCYFVMGDNRDQSFGDSRFSGPVQLEDIKGKVNYILYSREVSRIGKKVGSKSRGALE